MDRLACPDEDRGLVAVAGLQMLSADLAVGDAGVVAVTAVPAAFGQREPPADQSSVVQAAKELDLAANVRRDELISPIRGLAGNATDFFQRLAAVFGETDNPFPWMSEAMDLKKEKNFFETRVTEYQNGSALAWD